MSEQFDNEFDRLVAGKLDGDLTPSDAKRLEAMLAADEQAERETRQLERVDRLVRAWGARGAEADWTSFRAGVMECLFREEEQRARKRRLYRFVSYAAPLAAAAVVAMALMIYWRGAPNGGPHPLPDSQVLVEVTYQRPASSATPAATEGIHVVFTRSAELERTTAAYDAAGEDAPSLAVAAGSKAAAPAAPDPELFPL